MAHFSDFNWICSHGRKTCYIVINVCGVPHFTVVTFILCSLGGSNKAELHVGESRHEVRGPTTLRTRRLAQYRPRGHPHAEGRLSAAGERASARRRNAERVQYSGVRRSSATSVPQRPKIIQ